MYKILALVGAWLLQNSIQKVLLGAGLGLVSYLGVMTAVRTAFNSLIQQVNSIGADLLNLMGIYGIDYVLSAFVSVAVFLLTLNSGKLMIRRK